MYPTKGRKVDEGFDESSAWKAIPTEARMNEPSTLQRFIHRLQQRHESRLVFPNLEEDIVKVVDLILRTERTVAGVRETQAQSFVLIRHVVQIDVETYHWDLCHRVRTTSVHVEEGERAETVSGRTGHQRDGVQALSLNLRGQTHNSLVEGIWRERSGHVPRLKYQSLASSSVRICQWVVTKDDEPVGCEGYQHFRHI